MLSAPAKKPQAFFPVYPKQLEFLDAAEPVRGFVGGQGCGKSKIGAYDLLSRAKPGRLYMVVTPTYPMLRDATFRTFREVARQLGRWRDDWFQKTEFIGKVYTAEVGGTAEILFRSGDAPDRLRGPNLSGVWMDEASLLDHEAYQICTARLREHGEAGWLSATFTPKGLAHWTYEVFGKERPGVKLVHASTRDNPFVAGAFVERVYQEYSGLRAEQELQGRFVSVEGAEWPAEYFAPHIWFDEWPTDCVLRVLALDPSKGKESKHGDYQAFVLLGLDKAAHLWCEAWLEKMTTSQLVDFAVSLVQEHAPDAAVCEVNQFQELLAQNIRTRAQQLGVPYPAFGVDNRLNKEVRIRKIGPHLAAKEIHFKAGSKGTALLVQQLRDFPEGDHDDGPDSLEQGLRMLRSLLRGKRGGTDGKRSVDEPRPLG